MNNKNVLLLLVFFLIYINIFIPLSQSDNKLKNKIVSLKKSIEKDKLYIVNKDKINKKLEKATASNKLYNQAYFYQEENSKVFNLLQKEIKTLITTTELTEDNIKWGEAYSNKSITQFPITVRVFGGIEKIGVFLKDIYTIKKIYVKNFIVRKTKKYYFLELSVYGLKKD